MSVKEDGGVKFYIVGEWRQDQSDRFTGKYVEILMVYWLTVSQFCLTLAHSQYEGKMDIHGFIFKQVNRLKLKLTSSHAVQENKDD